jgi:hypothetical protein
MSDGGRRFIPAELDGGHYRPIGGSYETVTAAISALERHFSNTHGGGATFLVYRPDDAPDAAVIVEAGTPGGDPLAVRALYKVLAQYP